MITMRSEKICCFRKTNIGLYNLAFLYNTYKDCCIPVENALLMAIALRSRHMSFVKYMYFQEVPTDLHYMSIKSVDILQNVPVRLT